MNLGGSFRSRQAEEPRPAFDPNRPVKLVTAPRHTRELTPDTPIEPTHRPYTVRVLATDRVCPRGFTTVIAALEEEGRTGAEEHIWTVNAAGLVQEAPSLMFLVNYVPPPPGTLQSRLARYR